jgi:bis(5'-nucleosyl)-tetraphosphatase (symmetrical)
MSTWAIGDVQGCADELAQLLERIDIGADDRVWFVGDLVNRGPDSLGVLRRVRDMGEQAVVVLGNHDLHLLALALGAQGPKRKDTLDAVLAAPDREPLLEWLRHRPLLHHDEGLRYTMVHAGLSPDWDLERAISCAREAETALRGPDYLEFFEQMYGDQPQRWDPQLEGFDRFRFIINTLTRTRMLSTDSGLVLSAKGAPTENPELIPWFQFPGSRWQGRTTVVCGHWSALGVVSTDYHHQIDGGCVWGGDLAAICLEDGRLQSLGCGGYLQPR